MGWVNESKLNKSVAAAQSQDNIIRHSEICNCIESFVQHYHFSSNSVLRKFEPTLHNIDKISKKCANYYYMLCNEEGIIEDISDSSIEVKRKLLSEHSIKSIELTLKHPLLLFNYESDIVIYALITKSPFEIYAFKNGYVRFNTPPFVWMGAQNRKPKHICTLQNYFDYFADDEMQNEIWRSITHTITTYLLWQHLAHLQLKKTKEANSIKGAELNAFQILKFVFQLDGKMQIYFKQCKYRVKWSSKCDIIYDIKSEIILHIYELIIKMLKSIRSIIYQSPKITCRRMQELEIKNALRSIKFNPISNREETFAAYKKNPNSILQFYKGSRSITRQEINRQEREGAIIRIKKTKQMLSKPAYFVSESIRGSIETEYKKYLLDQTYKAPVQKRIVNWRKCLDLNEYIEERSMINQSPEKDRKRLVDSIESLSRAGNKREFAEAWDSICVEFPMHNHNEKEIDRIYNTRKSNMIAHKVSKRLEMRNTSNFSFRLTTMKSRKQSTQNRDKLSNSIAEYYRPDQDPLNALNSMSLVEEVKKNNKTLQSLITDKVRAFCAQSYANFISKLQLIYRKVNNYIGKWSRKSGANN